MQTPTGTTQEQADQIFYSQVAAGALVGFVPGQSISGARSSLVKFELSRLDRGTAGVDDTVILAIINGLPTVASVPPLVDVPLQNPIDQADIASITSTGFTPPAIGSLTSNQTQALMAQVANTVDQPATVITNEKGVGQYGLSCQQLEMSGYVKPGTWQQFLKSGSNNLVDVLKAPGIWTGKDGINTADQFLINPTAQNTAQSTLMVNGYDSLQATGVITTPAAQSIAAVNGQIFMGSNQPVNAITSTLTNNVNGQIAALVNNASRFGTQLTAQWAQGLPGLTNLTTNLVNIKGLSSQVFSGLPGLGNLTSGITPSLASVQTAMNSLGKVSQFASGAASTLTNGLSNLSNLSLSNLTSNLPSVSNLLGQAQSAVTGQVTALAGQLQGQATALLGQAQAQLGSLTGQLGSFNVTNLFGGVGDSLVASVQKAAGFSNTVNRATVDVAMIKVFGSNKIPVPSFEPKLPDSASLGAALDIAKAQNVLKDLQGRAQGAFSNLSSLNSGSLASVGTTVFNPNSSTLI